jgi:cysteine desulfuration protein SufE
MPLPEKLEKIIGRFQQMGREEKMAALVSYAKRLEAVPEHHLASTDEAFSVPECQTPVRIFPELRDGLIHFYADINTRQSPTVAAFLSLVFSVVNDQPPATTLAIPSDFVRGMMTGLGLGTREVGLDALVLRLKRHAREAQAAFERTEEAADS